MRANKTIKLMNSLGFYGMASAFELMSDEIKVTQRERKLLNQLLLSEQQEREDKRINNAVKKADLIYPMAHVNGLDFSFERSLNMEHYLSLQQSNWVAQKIPLIFTGEAGLGKKYMACALLRNAIECGRKVKCYETRELLEEIAHKRHASSELPTAWDRYKTQLKSFDILMLYNFGMKTIPTMQREDLAWLFDLRRKHGAFVIVSPVHTSKWTDFLGDTSIAKDIKASLVKLAHRFELGGEVIYADSIEEAHHD